MGASMRASQSIGRWDIGITGSGRKTIGTIGAGLLALLLAGCGHPAYQPAYFAPPPPPPSYYPAYPVPAFRAAESNGYADGLRDGRHDRDTGHSYRPEHSGRLEHPPGYYRELGGSYRDYCEGYRAHMSVAMVRVFRAAERKGSTPRRFRR
jgi:hypothetical protein